jgi:hypothetical protein
LSARCNGADAGSFKKVVSPDVAGLHFGAIDDDLSNIT